jgi:hypothetical protein
MNATLDQYLSNTCHADFPGGDVYFSYGYVPSLAAGIVFCALFCLTMIAHLVQVIWTNNFDYNQTVQHQTIRDPSEHISATTSKLCIGQSIPSGGLLRSMFHPEVPLDPHHIYMAAGNRDDNIRHQCQHH